MVSDGVYRKAADAINLLTNFSLSHSAIHSITQRVGLKSSRVDRAETLV